MALLEAEKTSAASSGTGDAEAIRGMQTAFNAQRRAFAADRTPTLAVRRKRLERIITMMEAYTDRIYIALSADFGAHSTGAADAFEVQPVILRAQFALAHLEEWMQPTPREVDPPYKGAMRAFLKSQPKGIVGNISPWNFPFEIGIGPMVDIIAAGNRFMLKPSDIAPACAELMQQMIAEYFAENLAYVAVGGLELARAFSDLPFDHLLYTGSSNVGKQIMAAAAKNLTPVTLELGGKCPAVFLKGSVIADVVNMVIGVKSIKNGQMCVSVDHCFVPRNELDNFARIASEFMAAAMPGYARSAACTGIVSDRHLERITEMLAEAEERKVRVVTLEADGKVDRKSRQMPLSLVLDPPEDLRMMREEIFGPILPVIPYDDIDGVIERINAKDRPLGVYVMGTDVPVIEHILSETVSGGAAVNMAAVQAGLKDLGFGGIGMSGMGRHHGIDGFREFSNQRGFVVRGEGAHFDAFVSPAQSVSELVGQVPAG
jgi:coniferyl-aldehyde dehydrogenase